MKRTFPIANAASRGRGKGRERKKGGTKFPFGQHHPII